MSPTDGQRRAATPQELAEGERQMKAAQERMEREAMERGEEAVEDLRSEETAIQVQSFAMTPTRPESFGPTPPMTQGPITPMVTNGPSVELAPSQVLHLAAAVPVPAHLLRTPEPRHSEAQVTPRTRPSAEVPRTSDSSQHPQQPLFTDDQLRQLSYLYQQAPMLYGSTRGQGFTPQQEIPPVSRPTFLQQDAARLHEKEVEELTKRIQSDQKEKDELKSLVQEALAENKVLKNRVQAMEGKILEPDPRFSTPESQKEGPKEAADPQKAETTDVKVEAQARPHPWSAPPALRLTKESEVKKEETGQEASHCEQREPQGTEAAQGVVRPPVYDEFGPGGLFGTPLPGNTREATPPPQDEFGLGGLLGNPLPTDQRPSGGGTGEGNSDRQFTEKSMAFMALMLETMQKLSQKVGDGKEEGSVKGVEIIRPGTPELPQLQPWHPVSGPLQLPRGRNDHKKVFPRSLTSVAVKKKHEREKQMQRKHPWP